jgi:hypothetical protein
MAFESVRLLRSGATRSASTGHVCGSGASRAGYRSSNRSLAMNCAPSSVPRAPQRLVALAVHLRARPAAHPPIGELSRCRRRQTCQVVPVHPHMLRHSCGFALANNGYDVGGIARRAAPLTIKPIGKDLIVLPDGGRRRDAAQRDPDAATGARFMNSQVAQEVQYILLVGCTQHIELSNHPAGFRAAAGMLLDGR